jgi:hypothetical protein
MFKYWWEKVVNAAPSNRNIDVCYFPLYRITDGGFIGSIIPEFYVLAKAEGLPCQIQEREWGSLYYQDKENRPDRDSDEYREALWEDQQTLYKKLYRKEGISNTYTKIRKTPQELAIYPSIDQDEIAVYIKDVILAVLEKGGALPTLISKFRGYPDYLEKNLFKADWTITKPHLNPQEKPWISRFLETVLDKWVWGLSTPGIGIKINLDNPAMKTSARERFLHYTGTWVSWLMTISSALAAFNLLGISSPWIFAGVMLACYLGKKATNDFTFFDTAEELHRTFGWLLTKELWRSHSLKISFRKMLETTIYLAAIVVCVYAAGVSSFEGTLKMFQELTSAVPFLANLFYSTGMSAATLQALQVLSASFFAFFTGLATWTGCTFTTRFFWVLNPFDTQIDFTPEIGSSVSTVNSIVQSAKFHKNQEIKKIQANNNFPEEIKQSWITFRTIQFKNYKALVKKSEKPVVSETSFSQHETRRMNAG